MPRTVPSVALQNPGNIITHTLWNNGPKAIGDFCVGPPIFRARTSATNSAASGSYVALSFNISDVDSESGHSNSVNNSRYTAQVAGWYQVMGIVVWGSSGVFNAWSAVAKNGAVVAGSPQVLQKPSTYSGILSEALVQLNVGDYIEIWAKQESGGSLSTANFVDLGNSFTAFWVHS